MPQAAPTAARDDLERSDELFAKGVALHQAGDIIGAIDAYEQALEVKPWRLDARSNLGAAFVRLGRFDEAVEQYRKALETDSGSVPVRFNLGLALYKSGRIEEAAAEFQGTLDRDPSQQAALLLLADCLLQMGNDRQVIDLLSPHEDALGDDRLFAYLLGTALIHEDELRHGQILIDRLFRGGESAEGHLLLGVQHLGREDSRLAVPELRRAAELNPELPTVHSMLGVALMNNGERAEAITEFRRELERNPNDFQANLRLGLLLREENRLDTALDYMRRAGRVRPRDPDVLYGLGRIYVGRDDLESAEATLQELTEATPGFEPGHVLLANVYYRRGKRELGDQARATVERLRAERKAREGPSGAESDR